MIEYVIQCKPLKMITLGQVQTDNFNQMKIITNSSHTKTTALIVPETLSM